MLVWRLLLLTTLGVVHGKRPPNIVFIVADDLGWNDVSFHGSNQIPTPNIDHLAYSGIILNNYYVSPICTPSRSAIMTGRHPIHTGMQRDVIVGPEPYGLPLSEKLLPEWLSALSYKSSAVGKWHLGFCSKAYTPTYRGFQSYLGYWTGHQDYYDHTEEIFGMWGYDFRRNMTVAKDLVAEYATDVFTKEAVRVIKTHNQKQPLFLYLAHLAVHSANPGDPLQAPLETINKFKYIKDPKRRIYAAMAYTLDESVGEVVEALHQSGMLNNTIIVFTTDNGGPAAGFDRNAASNWPLRGVKNTLWEGGVRGAAALWSPILKKSGYVASQLMHVQDWLPTLYHAAGGNVKDLGNIDGLNMWESLSYNTKSPRQHLLHNIDDYVPTAAVRMGDWKLIHGIKYHGDWDGWYGPSGRNSSEVEEQETRQAWKNLYGGGKVEIVLKQTKLMPQWDWKYTRKAATVDCGVKPKNASSNCNPLKQPCLFNVREDPCEYRNLATERKDILKDLQKLLHQYNSTAVPPVNRPPDPRANPKYHEHVWEPWLDNQL